MSETIKFSLPDLEYGYDALEPHIDAETMEIHHTKHHAGYINKLNDTLEKGQFKFKSLEEILLNLSKEDMGELYWDIKNNAGGHYNHILFFKNISPNGGGMPKGELMEAINRDFASFDEFKERFTKSALSRFGSGFAWLMMDEDKRLYVKSTSNQDCPMEDMRYPLLCLDVWEHAYYLKYKNKRPSYVEAWWDIVNWDFVEKRYKEAQTLY